MNRLLLFLILFPTIVFSHEKNPSIFNVNLLEKNNKTKIRVVVQTNLESIISGYTHSHKSKDSKKRDYYKKLKKRSNEELKEEFMKQANKFQKNVYLKSQNKRIKLKIQKVIARDKKKQKSKIIFKTPTNEYKNLTVHWPKDYGPVIIRVKKDKKLLFTQYLKNGGSSKNFIIKNE